MSNIFKYRVIVLTALYMLIAGIFGQVSGAGKKLICDYCKREITNTKYVWVEDKYFHEEHFICRNCSKSLVNQNFYKYEDKYYCEKCYNEKFVPKCGYCGKPITGQYISFENKLYHDDCYSNHVAKVCSVCGEIINEEYFIDFWGNEYHSYHKDRMPMCDYCGRLICDKLTGGGVQYGDGRHICNLCRRETIDDIDVASNIMTEMSVILKRYGIEVSPKKINLQLVDKNRLKELSSINEEDQAGLTKYEYKSLAGIKTAESFNIYILYGMPELDFRTTMAHELMHVWLYNEASLEMDPALTEGSCNYASYLFLLDGRGRKAEYILQVMEENPNLFYGEGYRRVKKYVSRVGVEEWLEFLKSNKNFPSGY